MTKRWQTCKHYFIVGTFLLVIVWAEQRNVVPFRVFNNVHGQVSILLYVVWSFFLYVLQNQRWKPCSGMYIDTHNLS